jgi:hypothetical protein
MEGNPPASTGAKVSIMDTDHGGSVMDAHILWTNFCRGHSFWHMDALTGTGLPGRLTDRPDRVAGETAGRAAMKGARTACTFVGGSMALFQPQSGITSTGFCLARPGAGYIVYAPNHGPLTVDLSDAPREWSFVATWLPIDGFTGATTPATAVLGGAIRTFSPPFTPATLVLANASALASVEERR